MARKFADFSPILKTVDIMDQKKNSQRLMAIQESVASTLRADKNFNFKFGEQGWSTPEISSIKKMVKYLGDTAFRTDLMSAGENSGLGTNAAMNAKVKSEIVDSAKKEYVARAENLLIQTPNSSGLVNPITTHQQFYAVALVQGVVQPVSNKIVPTIVTEDPIYAREISYPILIDSEGKSHNLAVVLNDDEKLLRLTSASSAHVVFETAFTNKEVDINLIDEYNASVGSGQQIAGPRNYVNRGAKIVSITYDDAGTEKEVKTNYTIRENQTQSAEFSDFVGKIYLTLTPESSTKKEIIIMGGIKVDGSVKLTCNDANVKKISIAFNLPPVGIQSPFDISWANGVFQEQITQTITASMSLNPSMMKDYSFYTGQDQMETFQTQVLTTAVHRIDAYFFRGADLLVKELEDEIKHPQEYSNKENYFEDPTRKLLDKRVLDMAKVEHWYDEGIQGHNQYLARVLYEMMNKMDVHLNPQERRYTMYSDSALAQWLKDPYGAVASNFNIIGNANQEIAGLVTPYDIIRMQVGSFYPVSYVATNRRKATTEEVQPGPNNKLSSGEVGLRMVHEMTVIPDYEESKDTMIMAKGKEFLYEGTGTAIDPASASLNYISRFELIKMNKVIGRLTFKELMSELKA